MWTATLDSKKRSERKEEEEEKGKILGKYWKYLEKSGNFWTCFLFISSFFFPFPTGITVDWRKLGKGGRKGSLICGILLSLFFFFNQR